MDNFYNSEVDDFTFFDFTKRSGRGSSERTLFLKTETGCSYATIANNASMEVRQKGLRYVRVRKDNITGEVALVFNGDKGLRLMDNLFNEGKVGEKFRINSADFVRCLLRLMGDGDKTTATYDMSEDLSNSPLYATYKLHKRG